MLIMWWLKTFFLHLSTSTAALLRFPSTPQRILPFQSFKVNITDVIFLHRKNTLVLFCLLFCHTKKFLPFATDTLPHKYSLLANHNKTFAVQWHHIRSWWHLKMTADLPTFYFTYRCFIRYTLSNYMIINNRELYRMGHSGVLPQ